ncbi:peptidylprolyl isomerase [Salsipaludibacter albus]|uniref:peptidylprolyl isomerase n=1 Tax=Salsipaludibacter albus TaxID=2849650 RepID=UPI001EE3D674|nr:peptidylprolyl isomerase [Salsipaludibacter albus]MBY5163348.1 peptidylprolyl isomerase [Salsipaludibacter albus]
MSRKHQEKQQARARARREQERSQQRSQRRIVIAVVVVALAAAGALAWWLLVGQDDTPEVAASETPSAAPSSSPAATPSPGASASPVEESAAPTAGESADPSAVPADPDATEATEATAPCPPPTDAPEPDTSLQFDQAPPPDVTETVIATIETTCGTIVAELDGAAAPQTVSSFVFLAEEGFYDGTPFHRVQADFVIQGGDPTGTGTGGPGYAFDDELTLSEQVVADNDGLYPRGTLAMANSGPNTNGSQFFVVQAEPGYPFPPDYAVFGTVTEGMDVVDDIANGPVTGPSADQAVDPARIIDIVLEPATTP